MEKKRGILYWLRVILAAASVLFLFSRCCEGISIPVYADGPGEHPDTTHAVTLTPAQTLALFGTEIQGILYPTSNGSPVTITFDYAFPLDSIGYMDSGGGFDTDVALENIWTLDNNRQTEAEYLGESNGLVFVASSSQWGGVDVSPYGASQTVQLHCPFSISLSGITGIRQSILYSTASGSLNYWQFNQAGNIMTVLSDPNYTTGAILSNAARNGIRRATYIQMPTYPFYSSSGTVDETALQYFTMFYNSYQTETAFDIRGFTIDCYNVTNASSGSDLWLVVTCPTLYSYNPPVVTTTDAPTTFPTQTFPTATVPTGTDYDPHKIIIQNQNTQIMQLNLIIGQLDRIYNRMVNSGQIAVNLMPAEPLAELRTDIHSQIHDSLGSFTTSQIPSDYSSDMQHSFSFFNDLYSRFTSGPLAFFGWLGIFSLMSIVVSWFIFRGRG